MADRGILFSAPMVRALLGGRKTQTRRLLKHMPPHPDHNNVVHEPRHDAPYFDAYCGGKKTALNPRGMTDHWCWWTRDDRCGHGCKVPYIPGDRLWVRETWSHTGDHVFEIYQARMAGRWGVIYRADDDLRWPHAKWWPSIFLPREFSRITLTVTDVRVERLQAISREDAIAEGLIHKPGVIEPDWWMLPEPLHQGTFLSPVAAYSWLWNSLHDKPGERWDDDPWVVAVNFDVREGNIDA